MTQTNRTPLEAYVVRFLEQHGLFKVFLALLAAFVACAALLAWVTSQREAMFAASPSYLIELIDREGSEQLVFVAAADDLPHTSQRTADVRYEAACITDADGAQPCATQHLEVGTKAMARIRKQSDGRVALFLELTHTAHKASRKVGPLELPTLSHESLTQSLVMDASGGTVPIGTFRLRVTRL